MNKLLDNISLEQNFTQLNLEFLIIGANVGIKDTSAKHPKLINDWNYSEDEKFKNLHHHRIWIMLDGEAYIKTTFGNFTLEKGKAYFIPASTIISTNCPKYMMQLFIDFLPNNKNGISLDIFEFQHVSPDYIFLLALSRKIISIYKKTDLKNRNLANNIMSCILSCFITGYKKNKKANHNFIPAITYINKNLHKDIEIKELSSILNYTPEYFSAIFKKTFNVSPVHYILKTRLNKAKIYLTTTNDSIKNIALKVGFTDPYYFSRVFKKENLISPKEFRTKNKEVLKKQHTLK